MIGPMPWFAWLWCIGMTACIAFIGYCAWSVGQPTKRIRRARERQP